MGRRRRSNTEPRSHGAHREITLRREYGHLQHRPGGGTQAAPLSAAPGAPETVVLTAGYWRSKFGGDSSVVGRSLMLNSRPREIIGVLPDTFRFLDRQISLVVPYQLDRGKTFLGQFSYAAIARLKPGVTVDQASADVARMLPMALSSFPPIAGLSVKMFEEARLTPHLLSLQDDLVGEVKRVLLVLMGTIGLVLLVACANIANLLLVRAESRQQELAVRAALGAGTSRIARELLSESVTLGVLGGASGSGSRSARCDCCSPWPLGTCRASRRSR